MPTTRPEVPEFGGAGTIQNLLNQYQGLLAQNQSRYEDILAAYRARATALEGNLNVIGQNQLAQANRRWDQEQAGATQSLISRGLGNTTVRDATRTGIEEQRSYDLNQINNQIAQQQIGFQGQFTGDTLNFMQGYQALSRPSYETMGNLANMYDSLRYQEWTRRYPLVSTSSSVGRSSLPPPGASNLGVQFPESTFSTRLG